MWMTLLRAAHLEPGMMSHECCAGSDKHMTSGRIDQVENV